MKGKRKGFTLIELLIVMVIIGIICAITIPKFANSKQNTYLVSMKSDLRNLSTYQESFAADSSGHYFSGNGAAQGFFPSQSVSINATALNGQPSSWSANATHGRTTKTCSTNGFGVATCS